MKIKLKNFITTAPICLCLTLSLNLMFSSQSFAQKAACKTVGVAKTLKSPTGDKLKLRLAVTIPEQTQGLSGLQPNQFGDDEAMLFFYNTDSEKSFWMPDTYFDLDIYFLDKDLMVIDVERNVRHHPTRKTPPAIATTRHIFARHVLEMKASSPLSKKIKVSQKFSWEQPECRWEIESNIRQKK